MRKILLTLLLVFAIKTTAQEKAIPIFKDGEAQIVAAFNDANKWIRTNLWLETTFDTEGNGKLYRMTFDLQPDNQIIKKGQQIGLTIFSSDRNYTLLPKHGTELTIDLNATSITNPLVGGKNAFIKAIE